MVVSLRCELLPLVFMVELFLLVELTLSGSLRDAASRRYDWRHAIRTPSRDLDWNGHTQGSIQSPVDRLVVKQKQSGKFLVMCDRPSKCIHNGSQALAQ